ncbi:MAG: hypothetical protein B7X06_02075 [Verrucomicrobia bacterium 21-51-4]|nr:MAG: hypothetical protein B7X06_02075 [Verrucomicrobia bacterium 21-51-4]HQU09113.1 OmpH family outer membrane protein [Opitutales bacterium]
MKKLLLALSLALCSGALFAADKAPASTAASASGSYLTADVQKIFQNYYKAQDAQAKLQASADRAQQEMNAMLESGRDMVKQLQDLRDKSNNPAFNDDARSKFTAEADDTEMQIRQKERELNEFRMQTERTLNQQNATLVEMSMQEIQTAIKKIAQDRGVNLVLNSSGPFVVYSDLGLDITDLALTRLNADKPKTADKKGASDSKAAPAKTSSNTNVKSSSKTASN